MKFSSHQITNLALHPLPLTTAPPGVRVEAASRVRVEAASIEAASLEAASLEAASLEEASTEAARAGGGWVDRPRTPYPPPHPTPNFYSGGCLFPYWDCRVGNLILHMFL